MGDTPSYRAAAAGLRHGWPTLLDRTPGYPALLLVTGSSEGSTVLLFLAQAAMHVLSILLVTDALRTVGVGPRGRLCAAVLLVAPPVMIRVLNEGSEGLAALLLTTLFWLLTAKRPLLHELRFCFLVGSACCALAVVRPTFALVFGPVAAIVAVSARRNGAQMLQRILVVCLPSLVVLGGLSISNALRFDSPGLTPLLPYHLSSRTSPYVEELPPSFEPARSVLIEARDEALLQGESTAPANFIWSARDELERATGMSGVELDRYLMTIDVELIANNPFAYLDTVRTALSNMTTMDSQPAVLGLGRPVVWVEQGVHLLVLFVFGAVVATTPGLVLAGRVSRDRMAFLLVAVALSGYTVLISVMAESGTARLRAPAEPILVALLVLATSILRRELDRCRSSRAEGARIVR